MEAYLLQWLELGARWLHVVAGAVWIGTSFYFNWLNHSLRPPRSARPGISGELESVHGGAFYRVDRFAGSPERLPERLHWFRWEAYATWLSGFALLILVYYLGSGGLLRDPVDPAIGQGAAIAVGIGSLLVGWFAYDLLCRSALVDRPVAFTTVLTVFVAAVAWALAEVLSGRAAFIHVGAMIGTWMAANVFLVIIPGQRAIVRAIETGGAPDLVRGRRGAIRSLHNNYLTLPVLFLMVSIHYPVVYTHPSSWIILVAVGLAGVLARVYFNRKHQGSHLPWALPAGALALIVLVFATVPWATRGGAKLSGPGDSRSPERASFAVVRAIVEERCVACHAVAPSHADYPAAPLGVVLDSPEAIRGQADRIGTVVETGTMPLGNETGMTPEERAIVVRWVAEKAAGERSTD